MHIGITFWHWIPVLCALITAVIVCLFNGWESHFWRSLFCTFEREPSLAMIIDEKITKQPNFVPKKSEYTNQIYVASNIKGVRVGFEEFRPCPVKNCFITQRSQDQSAADVVVLNAWSEMSQVNRRHDQLWILQLLESPANMPSLHHLKNKVYKREMLPVYALPKFR
jgi:hypothetical protein